MARGDGGDARLGEPSAGRLPEDVVPGLGHSPGVFRCHRQLLGGDLRRHHPAVQQQIAPAEIVAQLHGTDAVVRALAEAAQKIGDVVIPELH
jgi:hypothetical protein